MEEHRRVIGFFGSIVLVAGCGWMAVDIIVQSCAELSKRECHILWGLAAASAVGGILVTETLVARRKARGQWHLHAEDIEGQAPTLSSLQVWLRSISRVVLASLLGGLPAFLLGAFGLGFFGTLTGVFFDLLMRFTLNRIAPVKEGTDS
jgi:hypothetical protein